MARKHGLVLSKPIVNDYSPDVPITYVENMMRDMFEGKSHPTVAGTQVMNLVKLWVEGMTRVAADLMQGV